MPDRHHALLLLLPIALSACTEIQPCPTGTERVFCRVDIYTARVVTKAQPPPETYCTTTTTIAFCVAKGQMQGRTVLSSLGHWISVYWPQTIVEFGRFGGLWAAPHREPDARAADPCRFADVNPWPVDPLIVIHTDALEGDLAELHAEGVGGGGGAPAAPPPITCSQPAQMLGGTGGTPNVSCGMSGDNCDDDSQCCAGFACTLNACDVGARKHRGQP